MIMGVNSGVPVAIKPHWEENSFNAAAPAPFFRTIKMGF
jgi:hypothetical protein